MLLLHSAGIGLETARALPWFGWGLWIFARSRSACAFAVGQLASRAARAVRAPIDQQTPVTRLSVTVSCCFDALPAFLVSFVEAP